MPSKSAAPALASPALEAAVEFSSASLSPAGRYAAWCSAGKIKEDAGQAGAVMALDALYLAIHNKARDGLWPRLASFAERLVPMTARGVAGGGLYLHGPVGRGKTMLLDLFANPPPLATTRRVHFHKFMLEVHDRLHRERQVSEVQDPVGHLAKQMAGDVRVLCFDELQVTNVADAMIVGRLFTGFLDAGMTIVATSNFAPEELYKGGLQRERFLPFIALLQKRLSIFAIGEGRDHRRDRLLGVASYFSPIDSLSREQLMAAFAAFTDRAMVSAETLSVAGRLLPVPKVAAGAAWFSFAELCDRPLGAADYLAIAQCYPALFLEGVPAFTAENRDTAQRFITLIDVLYECKVKVFLQAAVGADRLYPKDGVLAPLFARTASRLAEMDSAAYRDLPHLG